MEVPEASSHSFFDSDSLRQSPRAWVCRENGEYFQTNRNISLSVSVNDNLMVNQSLSEFSRATGSAGHFRCCSSLFSQLYIISLLFSHSFTLLGKDLRLWDEDNLNLRDGKVYIFVFCWYQNVGCRLPDSLTDSDCCSMAIISLFGIFSKKWRQKSKS